MDMQYVLSRQKVIKYVAKYATKAEPRSKALRELFGNIVRTIKDDGTSLKVVQKLLVNTVGERDFSAQVTCHLLLQLPMYRATRNFVILSLDGSREVDDNLEADRPVTVESQLDHYCTRPRIPDHEALSILQFVQKYRMPKTVGEALVLRRKEVVVIPRPCISEPHEDVSEKPLVTSLSHDLLHNYSAVKEVVVGTSQVRQLRPRHRGVQWQVHDRWQLTPVTNQQTGAPPQAALELYSFTIEIQFNIDVWT